MITAFERWQTVEANKRPAPRNSPAGDIREALHSEREGEYERYMVLAALKAAARENSKEGVK